MSGVRLRVDWCSGEAARFAVEHWHYSRSMPVGRLAHCGAWENDRYIGAVVFGMGANRNIAKPYGLEQLQVCELVRVALAGHLSPVSRIVSIAIRMLRSQSPGLRLIVSYADPEQGHNGAIYQAMNWVYQGRTGGGTELLMPNGERMHKRTAFSRFGRCGAASIGATYVQLEAKHKYLYPLDDVMREQIDALRAPYPKRAGGADSGTPESQPEGALQYDPGALGNTTVR